MGTRRVGAGGLAAVGGSTLVAAGVWMAVGFAGVWTVSPTAHAQAPTAVGSNGCGGSECHKNVELAWLTAKPGGQEHSGSFRKLKQAKDNSDKYAKAVGLAKFEDPAGMCVKCHATYVSKAQTLEGVGCEGCHGPASGYREFHSQNSKERNGSVKRGMRDLFRKPAAWVEVCRGCHVLDKKPEYAALLEEGHKSGDRWNVAKKYGNIQAHWKTTTTYTVAMITDAAAGKPVVLAAPPPPPPASTPPPTATPKPPPAPAPSPTATPTPTPPPVSTSKPTPTPTPPPVSTSKPTPTPTPPPVPTSRPAPPPVSTPTLTRTPPPEPTPPPAPVPPPLSGSGVSPLSQASSPPASAAGLLAALQDGVAGLLESLLRRDSVLPASVKPLAPPPRITGPDADLVRLQDEALALAVEALNLRAKPVKPSPPK